MIFPEKCYSGFVILPVRNVSMEMYYVLVCTKQSHCSLWYVVWIRRKVCQDKVWKLSSNLPNLVHAEIQDSWNWKKQLLASKMALLTTTTEETLNCISYWNYVYIRTVIMILWCASEKHVTIARTCEAVTTRNYFQNVQVLSRQSRTQV